MNQELILNSIVKLSEEYFIENDIKKSMDSFLDELLKLTESEYGFIGTIENNGKQNYLKTLAITDISWNEETRIFYNDNVATGLEFFNLNSLFGEAIKTCDVVISNTPETDKRACGIPTGHPPLNSFTAIPFKCGGRFVGMCGLANRPGGYSEKLIEELTPLNKCIAALIYNFKLSQEKSSLNTGLIQKSKLISKIFGNAADAMFAIDKTGIIQSVSQSALSLFGYRENEMVGQNVKIIVNEEHRDKHDGYLKKYLETGETNVINTIRTIDAVKKDGTLFPIELSVSAIEIEDIWFLGIIRDLTSQKVYLESIEKAKRAAEQHSQAKSEFLAIMSHELRTPLNRIMGALQSLMHEGLQHPDINEAYKQSQSLLSSLNTILDYSRLKVGLYDIEEKVFNLRDLLNELEELSARMALNKGLEFNISLDTKTECNFLSAPYRIKQILLNLIDNAIKFTDEGSVSLNVNVQEIDEFSSVCYFDIVDTGCGLSHDKIQKIFNDFSKGDKAQLQSENGFGLGLSISLMVAEILDGQIAIDSELGSGSTFTLCLPLKAAPKISVSSSEEKVSNDEKKALIVEDNPVNQKILAKMLSKIGVESDIADNGQIGLEMFETGNYSMIFMDLMMPVMNGFECARNIRLMDEKVPIITVSANNDATHVKKSRECGMNDFISKPISRDRLNDLVLKFKGLD